MTTREAASRLELDPEAMRRLGYRVVDLLVAHHADIEGTVALLAKLGAEAADRA